MKNDALSNMDRRTAHAWWLPPHYPSSSPASPSRPRATHYMWTAPDGLLCITMRSIRILTMTGVRTVRGHVASCPRLPHLMTLSLHVHPIGLWENGHIFYCISIHMYLILDHLRSVICTGPVSRMATFIFYHPDMNRYQWLNTDCIES